MFLTDNISKRLWTPFSGKYLIAHVVSTNVDGNMSADALQPLYMIAVV
jgi:dihydroorotase-like cyclic amidohydrolase